MKKVVYKKSIIIVLSVFIILLVVLLGTNMFKDKNQNNSVPSNNQKEVDPELITIAGNTYRTKNNTKTLKIVDIKDNGSRELAKQDDFYEDEITNRQYFGYYNDELFFLNLYTKTPKYFVVGGRKVGGDATQCPDTYQFIIDVSNNILVNLNYDGTPYGHYYNVIKSGNNYYFAEGGCGGIFIPDKLYTEKLEVIGDYLINSDSKGIYVLKDGYIIMYDYNNQVIKKSNLKYNMFDIGSNSVIVDSTLYILHEKDDKLYLVDALNDKEYEIGDSYYLCVVGADCNPVGLELKDKEITITVNKLGDFYNDDVYHFNTKTKTMTK